MNTCIIITDYLYIIRRSKTKLHFRLVYFKRKTCDRVSKIETDDSKTELIKGEKHVLTTFPVSRYFQPFWFVAWWDYSKVDHIWFQKIWSTYKFNLHLTKTGLLGMFKKTQTNICLLLWTSVWLTGEGVHPHVKSHTFVRLFSIGSLQGL